VQRVLNGEKVLNSLFLHWNSLNHGSIQPCSGREPLTRARLKVAMTGVQGGRAIMSLNECHYVPEKKVQDGSFARMRRYVPQVCHYVAQ
jgi:hypothetical protein